MNMKTENRDNPAGTRRKQQISVYNINLFTLNRSYMEGASTAGEVKSECNFLLIK